EGFDGSVVLVSGEKQVPYERPPLSKGFLLGTEAAEKAQVHEPGWYAAHDVDLRLGTWASGIDLAAHTVALEGGGAVGYDRLLLATGAFPRKLAVPGAEDAPLHYLRSLANSERLRADLQPGGRRVVVVGGGWIGLEVAAAARTYGNDVTVIEPQPAPLLAALGAEMGGVFADLHRANGVVLVLGTGVSALERHGPSWTVVDAAGTPHEADVVVVGVGARPATDLAEAAGLAVDNGVVVDASLRTSDPDVFAAGDVASAYSPLLGRHLRVEHWANALHAGPAAARAMLGQEVSFDRVPYFYSDQYDLGMEFSGHPEGYARVVTRGDVAGREFVAFWLDAADVVLAGMNVNVWDVTDAIQALVRARRPVDVARLTDAGVPLGEVLGA
ncbi:MAG TPA: FAD-dependent oxidoreductase, partial [Actinomycetes bacterium]|nr:FAD-dependent oxidoreductase [Actinomycetes bacterium]